MSYEKQKRYERRKSAEVADIGEIPAVVNPARRAACERDLLLFLVTYFPRSTGLKPFSADHKDAIGRMQGCGLAGGLFAQAFPRGGAKTTISENDVIWMILYRHRLFPVLFGADANAAGGNIESIKMELQENDLLYEDFPEVCHAIRALEGKPQRCASQCHIPGNVAGWKKRGKRGTEAKGQQTHIAWTADTIVLPTIFVPEGWGTVEGPKPGAKLVPSAASGAIIATRGLMSGSRGLKYKRPDGTQQRPDFVLIDDPQTDDSASTPLQVNKRLNVIRKNILKLGGHGRKLAGVMNATVIKKNDLVEQVFDPKKFPAWQCVRIKMVKRWSDVHDTLWMEEYARLRNTFDPDELGDQQRAHRAANEFYRLNRAKMDAGCEVFWEHCFDEETELSAIQHAYNLLIDDGEEVFASECQNEPLEERADGQQEGLDADAIAKKLNRLPRGVVPIEASRVTAFIDVHDHVLYWMVCGFGDGFGGGILDYGTWPDQKKAYFSHREVKRTMAKETGKPTFESQLYAGLDTLVNWLMSREWKREQDGTTFRIERLPIDARDNDHAETVKLFCRRSPHAAILMPSNGIYIGAKGSPMNDRKPQAGERRGWNWRLAITDRARVLRFDVNAWKSRVLSLLAAPAGARGSLSLFGEKPEAHRMLIDHLTGERGIRVEAKRVVTEYTAIPGRDVHWFDCLVGCGVAASVLGCDVVAAAPVARKARPRKKVSYL